MWHLPVRREKYIQNFGGEPQVRRPIERLRRKYGIILIWILKNRMEKVE
jgi:hypothetical protein